MKKLKKEFIERIADFFRFFKNYGYVVSTERFDEIDPGKEFFTVGFRRGFFLYELLVTDKQPKGIKDRIRQAWDFTKFWSVKKDGLYFRENKEKYIHFNYN